MEHCDEKWKKNNKKTLLKMLLLVNKYLKVQLNYLNYLFIYFLSR